MMMMMSVVLVPPPYKGRVSPVVQSRCDSLDKRLKSHYKRTKINLKHGTFQLPPPTANSNSLCLWCVTNTINYLHKRVLDKIVFIQFYKTTDDARA